MTDHPADNAPSIDQYEAATEILRKQVHPLLTGYLVHGHSATYGPTTGIYWLCVYVTEAPDEIYEAQRTRCYAIAADGTYGVSMLEGWQSAQSFIG